MKTSKKAKSKGHKERWVPPPEKDVIDLGNPKIQESVKRSGEDYELLKYFACYPLPSSQPYIEDIEKIFKIFEESSTHVSVCTYHELGEDDVAALLRITRYCIKTLNKTIEDYPQLIITWNFPFGLLFIS